MAANPADPRLDQYDATIRNADTAQASLAKTRLMAVAVCILTSGLVTFISSWVWIAAFAVLVGAQTLSVALRVRIHRVAEVADDARWEAHAIRCPSSEWPPDLAPKLLALTDRGRSMGRLDRASAFWFDVTAHPAMWLGVALTAHTGSVALRVVLGCVAAVSGAALGVGIWAVIQIRAAHKAIEALAAVEAARRGVLTEDDD